MSEAADKISDIIEATVESLGFELIRVTYGGGRKPTLQIMAERPDGTMNVDDCATLSREISLLLDVEDPLPEEYLLEVSSPGIDRPLTRVKDFERWIGFDAKIELNEQLDGRRRFRGKMLKFDGETISISTDEGDFDLAYADVSKAKLLLTDELLEAVQKNAPDQAANE
ncbi:ribosome maturation factor RimP [Kordiimonas sp. SCSIO 12603]|uniref:ribosome maturation factor RimP n=1 Tax=Kordiimonas sp. SCSIO 12603 TaxID=2829596 RepID=UPI002105AFD5|nr:ribosome maturation factor RimP [Kordiimonas sp. SCSIO 12603]UTW58635.1 ribosome maturation factor RimP [Kordiimonas sp. SCSIO 12603]